MLDSENSKPNLEYNLAGGLPLTVRATDFERLCRGVAEAGYTHAALLPFRALTKPGAIADLRKQPLTIVHLERAWNPTAWDKPILAGLTGLLGWAERETDKRVKKWFPQLDLVKHPTAQDAAFPSLATCDDLFRQIYQAFPGVKYVAHDLELGFSSDRLLVEINNGIRLSPEELLAHSEEEGFGLVFDPSHLLAAKRTVSLPGQPTKAASNEWERQFNCFSSQIEVVDINPPEPREKHTRDLLGGSGLLAELAAAVKEIPQIEFLRVEIEMPLTDQLLHPQKGFEFLAAIGRALKEA